MVIKDPQLLAILRYTHDAGAELFFVIFLIKQAQKYLRGNRSHYHVLVVA
jgi:hypothetical protein